MHRVAHLLVNPPDRAGHARGKLSDAALFVVNVSGDGQLVRHRPAGDIDKVDAHLFDRFTRPAPPAAAPAAWDRHLGRWRNLKRPAQRSVDGW